MLFQEPGRTNYDINFSLFGFSSRIHPGFFIMPLVLFSSFLQTAQNPGVALVIIITVFFLSIWFHELGHALAFRYYGVSSHIVLYWMGGLAVPDGTSFGQRRTLDSNGQIVVSLAGPFFNFLQGGLLLGLLYLMGGYVEIVWGGFLPVLAPHFGESFPFPNDAVRYFFLFSLYSNIIWGVFNLVPVYPLDGGQAAREVFMQADGHSGLRNSLILSIVVAGLIAVYGLQTRSMFLMLLFGYMAYSNYLMLQHGGRFGGGW